MATVLPSELKETEKPLSSPAASPPLSSAVSSAGAATSVFSVSSAPANCVGTAKSTNPSTAKSSANLEIKLDIGISSLLFRSGKNLTGAGLPHCDRRHKHCSDGKPTDPGGFSLRFEIPIRFSPSCWSLFWRSLFWPLVQLWTERPEVAHRRSVHPEHPIRWQTGSRRHGSGVLVSRPCHHCGTS